MRNVVVALDGSRSSRLALDWVRSMVPARENATLHLVHGFEPIYPMGDIGASGYVIDMERGRQIGEELMNEAAATLEGYQVERHLMKEMASRALLHVAERVEPDLIAVGRRGGNPVSQLLLGGVSADVVHHSRFPVLVVNLSEAKPIQRILVGVDGSDHSARALGFAADNFPEAEITALHVVPTSKELRVVYGDVDKHVDPEKERQAQEVVGHTIEKAGVLPDRIVARAGAGSPAEGLLLAYRSGEFDLAVVGSRGLGALGELFLGSVSERMLRLGSGPVIVVK